jgi:hypothetical protein
MAFCNSCGANLEGGAKFCPKCGAGQPVSGTVPAVTSSAPPAPSQGTDATKIILIVVAVIVVLCIAGIGTVSFIGWRIARHTHIDSNNGNVRVESPFGTVESTTDPEAVARNLGVELYPGASLLKGKSASVDMGGMHSVTAQLETDDTMDKVADFYKQKFPNANVSVKDSSGGYTIVSTDNKNVITVNVKTEDGKTRIIIANVSGKGVTGGSSN